MRDIGHEVAPHGFEALELRNVARQYHLLVVAKGNDLNLQRQAAAASGRHDQGFVVLAGLQVMYELGLANQIGDRRTDVARVIEAEVLLGLEVDPFDRVAVGEIQHPVRHGLAGVMKTLKCRRQTFAHVVRHPRSAIQFGKDLPPAPGRARHRRTDWLTAPHDEPDQVMHVPAEQEQHAHNEGGQPPGHTGKEGGRGRDQCQETQRRQHAGP